MSYGFFILLAAGLAALVLLVSAATAYVLAHPPRLTVGGAVARGLPADPAEAGARYEAHTIRDAQGHAIELWAVEGRDPAGPVMILMHGWAGSRLGGLGWLDVLRPLVSELVLFDQRAHGESPQARCTWGRQECGDTLAIVEWCARRAREAQPGAAVPHPFEERPLVLMGCSMGAAVAIETAVAAGEGVIAAVVADSPYRRPVDAARRTMRQMGLPGRPFADIGFAMLALTGCRFRCRDMTEAAARLTQPLLVLHGAKDAVAPVEDARAIAAAAPRGRVQVFDEAEHLQAACEDPKGYEDALRRFLAEAGGQMSAVRGRISEGGS